MDPNTHSKSHSNIHSNREPIKTTLHKREEEKPQTNKKNLSKKDKIRKLVFTAIMKYSLLIGLLIGIVVMLLGQFEHAFLPINIFLLMMGTIYSIFNFKDREELFKEFLTMIGTIGFIVLLLTYITNTVQYTPITREGIITIFTHLQYTLSIFVSLFAVPCLYASIKLLFFPKKE